MMHIRWVCSVETVYAFIVSSDEIHEGYSHLDDAEANVGLRIARIQGCADL